MVHTPRGEIRRANGVRGFAAVLAVWLVSGCATTSLESTAGVHQDLKVAHAPRDISRTIQRSALRLQVGEESVELPLLESAAHSRKRLNELSSDSIGERPLFRVRTTQEESREEGLPSLSGVSAMNPWLRKPTFGRLGQTVLFEDPLNGEIPASPIQACRLQTCDPSFFWCLGTGMADEERGARWTSAAIFPLDETDTELPSLQIYGTTTRERDYLQVMPGFFWKPTRDFYLTVGVPVGMSDDAPDWGVLVALAR